MARRGRKQDSPGLKLAKVGRAGKVPPPAGAPEPPAYLDGEALAEWRRLAGLFDATASEGPLLDIYAVAFGRWRLASVELAANGPIICSGSEALKANPAAAVAKAAEDTLVKIMAELERRATLRRSGEAPKDDLGEFLARKA